MKRYFFLLLFLHLNTFFLFSQTTIFDKLSKKEVGKGNVTVRQPISVQKLVGIRSNSEKVEIIGDKSYLVLPGYRIQVFSGNDQRKSKDEAFSKKGQIDNLNTGVSTYVTYTAPFWRLRVGDYTSYEEAFTMMNKIIDEYPSFKREVHILKEEIRIPLN